MPNNRKMKAGWAVGLDGRPTAPSPPSASDPTPVEERSRARLGLGRRSFATCRGASASSGCDRRDAFGSPTSRSAQSGGGRDGRRAQGDGTVFVVDAGRVRVKEGPWHVFGPVGDAGRTIRHGCGRRGPREGARRSTGQGADGTGRDAGRGERPRPRGGDGGDGGDSSTSKSPANRPVVRETSCTTPITPFRPRPAPPELLKCIKEALVGRACGESIMSWRNIAIAMMRFQPC